MYSTSVHHSPTACVMANLQCCAFVCSIRNLVAFVENGAVVGNGVSIRLLRSSSRKWCGCLAGEMNIRLHRLQLRSLCRNRYGTVVGEKRDEHSYRGAFVESDTDTILLLGGMNIRETCRLG